MFKKNRMTVVEMNSLSWALMENQGWETFCVIGSAAIMTYDANARRQEMRNAHRMADNLFAQLLEMEGAR